jgi:uncharacterized protein
MGSNLATGMANRLAQETSPYLLQHAENPVDWYPWGEEAFARARAEDKPVLVSIGYSACHWCHVMERESFEDAAIAEAMNRHLVCIKVDREERPDVDAIYMEALQAMTGHGGWPLNAFADPDGVPFFAGTYYPPRQRGGMPSWTQVLAGVEEAWREQRSEIAQHAERIVPRLAGASNLVAPSGGLDPAGLDAAVAGLRRAYDPEHGGFGGAPKFPAPSLIEFLLRRGEHGMALHTLRAMAGGGMYDQIGGGFSRYSVDERWIVPHFEKMLYDNAQLARAYLHGWLVSGDPLFERVLRETLDWALRELRQPEGGFASALDADSEGVEGKFYVWTPEELRAALGDDALHEVAVAHWGVTPGGNFEGKSILVRAGSDDDPPELPEIKRRLMAARDERVRPGLDDKRLTAWNALMIAALAEAGAVLERADYLDAARACADFLLRELRTPDGDGRLLRTWKDGRAHLAGYLEDHAFLLEALLTLYEATFDPRWFAEARALADVTIAHFGDEQRGGFFSTADDHEQLVARRKDLEDTPIPSGNSSMALGLLRLARLTGEAAYEERAGGTIALLHPIAARHPLAFAHLLQAVDLLLADDVREVAIVGTGPDAEALVRTVRGAFRPHVVLAGGPGDGDGSPVPLLADRQPLDGRAAAYVCERFACQAPVTEPDALAALLD